MSWFKDVTEYIHNHLEDFAHVFLNAKEIDKSGKSLKIDPCPFCDHNGCFSLTKGVNGFYCFSCKAKGTLINAVEQLEGDEVEARYALAKWSGIKYNYASYTPEQREAKVKHDRFQQLCKEAVKFYHTRLVKTKIDVNGQEISPGQYQRDVRKHDYETLMKYKVGYSGGRKNLVAGLLKKGYEQEEIDKALKELIGFPEGYFLYPYFDEKGNLVRINAKLFVRGCYGSKGEDGYNFDCNYHTLELDSETKKKHESTTGHKMRPDNLSKGSKLGAFLFSAKEWKNKKYAIPVEGENDLLSIDEALQKMPPVYKKEFLPICIGGNSPEGMFESKFLRKFEAVYEAFDNDDAGDTYREQLDREMPEVQLKSISIPNDYDDIDLFLKTDPDALTQFEEMLDSAAVVPPKHYRITREGKKHIWSVNNRHYGLTYEIVSFKYTKNAYVGSLSMYKQGIKLNNKQGDIDSVTMPGMNEEVMRLRTALSDKINNYYHNVRWLHDEPERTFDELLDIFKFTKYKKEVTKQIAWYLYHASKKEKEFNIDRIKKSVRNEKEVAIILQEMTGYENQDIDLDTIYPEIHLSQSLFPLNKDGFMFFEMKVKDGEDTKRVPCLLSNHKEIIRLDIMKKKEAQSMLLINKKYELPEEVEQPPFKANELSLQAPYVMRWVNDELQEQEIHPAHVVGEIESFIRSTYYASDDVIKVVALWIYATYYYRLFTSGFPYLLVNGTKGSGKSTLDLILKLLCFNPTFTINTSEAAVYRRIDFFGGTFILDELENLTDSKEADKSGLAAVLKGGYSESGEVLRTDPNTNHARGYSAFGPKVISNIRGIDDIIADRCIRIDAVAGPESKLRHLKNPFEYKSEKRNFIYSLTSRAAISALNHFTTVDKIFKENTRVDTGNARLTQLLRPLITIARLVGGDYEEHLMRYYETAIKDAKEDVKMETLEGKIEFILKEISEELLGKVKENKFINTDHIYNKEIPFDKETGLFEIDTMHFKVFAQEMDSDKIYSDKEVKAAVKTVIGKNFDYENRRQKTKATIEDEGLLRQVNNQKYPHVFRYKLNVRDYVPTQTEALNYEPTETTETLF
ncbi:toprim domain-containing protein [Priestia megaterium]|uniref:toprim domain-containing protein n=1 Tax=Priestia megaterium TaxID=1404 RepID=UPI000BFCE7AC|nr:toprim domain-containing protein [Priestia megaterium]PGQ88240.1 hypothetical protein COA18_04755 [Priestia megaterium]